MLTKRIIPCLDMRDGRVVKGVQFENIVDAGDPIEAARAYNDAGADELVILDIDASHERRATMYDVVAKTAEQVFIPFTVGGGISSIDSIRDLLRLGADKVSINTPAVKEPAFIEQAAMRFGSQCIVVAVDIKKRREGEGWEVYVNGGRTPTGRDAMEWIYEVERRGAGEILLTSMDADGSKKGFDIGAIRQAASIVNIPLIASGGAGTLEHFYEAAQAGADAMLAASLFHFKELEILQVKQYLAEKGIPVRLDSLLK